VEVSLFASVFTEHDYVDYGCINADSFASLSFDFFSFRQALVGLSPWLQLWVKKKSNFAPFLNFWVILGTELLYTILAPNP